MDTQALAAHWAAGRFEQAAELVAAYTVPLVTERDGEFVAHDLAADGAEIISGTFQPLGARVMVDLESAFAMLGTSRGALFLYVGQPAVPGSRLYDSGGMPLPGIDIHSAASICGDSPWAGTTARRLVLDVDPTKPVTWQILSAILGPAGITAVPSPSQIAITPNGRWAFVTSPHDGTVTPISLGRPLYSYYSDQRPDDRGGPPIRTGAGATHLAADDVHLVVTNSDDDEAHVTIVDVESGDVIRQVRVDDGRPLGVAITPDGRHAVVGTTGGRVLLVPLAPGDVHAVQLPEAGRLRGVGVALDGSAAFVADLDGGVVHRLGLPGLALEATIPVGNNPWVVRVAPDGQVWVLGREEEANGRLRRIDPEANEVASDWELPRPAPNDLAIVPVAGQSSEIVRTAWVVYDSGYSEFNIGGTFAGIVHSIHQGAFAEDSAGPTGVAINDFGEIWVVRPSADLVFKWPGGRLLIRPGLVFGEYCSLAVYGAKALEAV
jgi:DNA-binding beta-propeller fold protein YncE